MKRLAVLSLAFMCAACFGLTHPSGATPKFGFWQPSWYIDQQNSTLLASDLNDCATPTTPCLTCAEFERRLGVSPNISQSTNVFKLSDGNAADPCNIRLSIDRGVTLAWYCAPTSVIGSGATALQTGTFSAVTNLAASTSTPTSVTDSLGRSMTPFVGQFVRDTVTGATTPIVKDLGSGAARTGVPATIGSTTTSIVTETTFNTTNAYQIDQLRKDWIGSILVTAGPNGTAPGGGLLIQDCDFQNFVNVNSIGAPVTLRRNRAMGNVLMNGFTNATLSMSDQATNGPVGVVVGNIRFEGGAIIGSSSSSANLTTFPGTWTQMDGDVLSEGGHGIAVRGGSIVLSAVGIYDTTTSAAFNPRGSAIAIGPNVTAAGAGGHVSLKTSFHGCQIYGSGNAGYGIDVFPGHEADYENNCTLKVTGGSGDIILGEDASSLRAFDPSVPGYTSAVSGTWTLLSTPISSGGFGGNAHNVERDSHLVKN